MGSRKPALAIAALPGRRARMIEYAKEVEQRGFEGVFVTSVSACLPFCQAVLQETSRITVGSSIQPIYFQSARLLADNAAFMHEISNGRFRLGIGISHAPALDRYGVKNTGRPVSDMRDYVAEMRSAENEVGPLPPIVLATLRDRMLDLACEVGDGCVWANGPRETVKKQLAARPKTSEDAFSTAAMVPTVIDDDVDAARNVHRKTLSRYVLLPNYRNYWKAAGFEQEMADVEAAIAAKDLDRIPSVLTDEWLDSTTLSGPESRVMEGIEAWYDAGIKTPIIVPSAIKGGQTAGIVSIFDMYDRKG
ncbi:MAG: LLM class flavin-dependent oxidoreductase [Minwuia sp.]|uniref:LLM class flavin-dependent oxidoreductase n=1 Tax=Minwuia sp. TaxID=2493630 RepID=UPI003A87130E